MGIYNTCIYNLSCGQFAIMILRKKSIFYALFLIISRLLTCHPLFLFFCYCLRKDKALVLYDSETISSFTRN